MDKFPEDEGSIDEQLRIAQDRISALREPRVILKDLGDIADALQAVLDVCKATVDAVSYMDRRGRPIR